MSNLEFQLGELLNTISKDIQNCMRDCLLKLFWPKNDIIKFFESNGVKNDHLTLLYDKKNTKRHIIIEETFDFLNRLGSKGELGFKAMLDSLLQWDYFDPFYFESLKKLDKYDAQQSLQNLRKIVEKKEKLFDKKINAKATQAEIKQQPTIDLEKLRIQFYDLLKDNTQSQKRGYLLESIILELAKHSNLEITEAFRVNGEQIDGAIKFDSEHYIFEAKWQEIQSSNESIYQFVGKIEGKLYGRGLFISINGFSQNVIDTIIKGKALKTIFIDGGDIMYVIDGRLTFSELLNKKVKAAQTKGLIYIDPITELQKSYHPK